MNVTTVTNCVERVSDELMKDDDADDSLTK